MRRFLYLFLIYFVCLACQQSGTTIITAEELKQKQQEGTQVVDIRTKNEFDSGHIPGALHIDYSQPDFAKRMEALGKETPIIIHCAKGGRSGRAMSILKEAGFVNVYDYSGGFSDWKQRGEKIEK
ncbi:MAG: rhodanese-like domain-containing protein [Ekhidna sp.]